MNGRIKLDPVAIFVDFLKAWLNHRFSFKHYIMLVVYVHMHTRPNKLIYCISLSYTNLYKISLYYIDMREYHKPCCVFTITTETVYAVTI